MSRLPVMTLLIAVEPNTDDFLQTGKDTRQPSKDDIKYIKLSKCDLPSQPND